MTWDALLIAAGFVPAVLFVALYLRSPAWWRSAMGRNIMAKMAILAGLLGLSLASMLWSIPPWVWRGGMGLLDAAIWWRLTILLRLRHDEGSER